MSFLTKSKSSGLSENPKRGVKKKKKRGGKGYFKAFTSISTYCHVTRAPTVMKLLCICILKINFQEQEDVQIQAWQLQFVLLARYNAFTGSVGKMG